MSSRTSHRRRRYSGDVSPRDRDRRAGSRKRSRRTESPAASGSEYNEDNDVEVHPIVYYIDDRAEMIEQVFSVVTGAKLKAMLTGSGLKDVPVGELKKLCLEQLEGMSKKRIR